MRFQIAFEGNGFFTRTKGNSGLDSPRAIFGSVGDLPGIMGKDTGIKILGEAGVMAGGIGFAHKYVDIMKFAQVRGLPWQASFYTSFLALVACQGVVRNENGDCCGNRARLRLWLRRGRLVRIYVSNEAWWRRRESNPRPKITHLGLYILVLVFYVHRPVFHQAGIPAGYPI